MSELTGPSIKRGQSKQDYETPPDFMSAIHKRFGVPEWDLAASLGNAKADEFISEEQNSLEWNWSILTKGLLYLNPPFDNIRPWARKCYKESEQGAHILFLVPASISSVWFCQYVFKKAVVHFLCGKNYRIKFVGAKDPYPKDLILVEFNCDKQPDFVLWPWREDASA